MVGSWTTAKVMDLQNDGLLLVEDGNHGEYRPRPEEFVDHGTSFIRAADMADGCVLFNSASKINETARQRITKGIGAPGDVLLSHKGTVGKVAFVQEDAPPFVCSPQTTFWRSLNPQRIDRKYLYAFMRSPGFHSQLATRSGETDMAPYVSLTSQRGLSVILPPIEIQRTIAHIIGALDDKLELNRKMNETLESTARALFKSWFIDFDPVRAKLDGRWKKGQSLPGFPTDFYDLFPDSIDSQPDGECPAGWAWVPLGKVMSNFDSKRIPLSGQERAKRRGPYPYHGAAGAMEGVDDFIFDGIYLLIGEDGSVVRDDGTAVTQYVWGKIWVNNHAHVLQGKDSISTEHLYLYFTFAKVAPYVTGAVQPKLSQGRMNSMRFLMPLRSVCETFDLQIQPFFQKRRALFDETEVLKTMRDSLLPRLLSGNLSIADVESFLKERGL